MDMEYGFVESENKATLIEAVNAQLAAGWQVCGGIAMAFYLTKWGEARRCYAQAMVRPQHGPVNSIPFRARPPQR